MTWSSVRITLGKEGRSVVLDYVRADLSDHALARADRTRAWVQRMAGHPTVLKAASHLLQKPAFSILREAILARAPSVVQDETGIDYGVLAQSFNVALYGHFTRPTSLFSQDAQRSLAEAYRRAEGVQRLSFRTSYQRQEPNLQVARRGGSDSAGTFARTSVERNSQGLELRVAEDLARYQTRERKLFLTRNADDPAHVAYVQAVQLHLSRMLAKQGVRPPAPLLMSLSIAPDGSLRETQIERGSGDRGRDRSFVSSLRAGTRFPEWPSTMRGIADLAVVTLHLMGDQP